MPSSRIRASSRNRPDSDPRVSSQTRNRASAGRTYCGCSAESLSARPRGVVPSRSLACHGTVTSKLRRRPARVSSLYSLLGKRSRVMFERVQRLLRLDRLERRLFGWLLLLTLVPMSHAAYRRLHRGARSLEWVGTLGPWDSVAESGRTLSTPAQARQPRRTRPWHRRWRRTASNCRTPCCSRAAGRFLGDRSRPPCPSLAPCWPLSSPRSRCGSGDVCPSSSRGRSRSWPAGPSSMAAASRCRRRDRANPSRSARSAPCARPCASLQSDAEGSDARAGDGARAGVGRDGAARGARDEEPADAAAAGRPPAGAASGRRRTLREPLEVIEEETARLDDLARSSRCSAGRPPGPASDVDVRDLLERLLDSDVPPASRRACVLRRIVPLVRAHYDALQRAFRNLIRNAVIPRSRSTSPRAARSTCTTRSIRSMMTGSST
jgi:hypothetical protein